MKRTLLFLFMNIGMIISMAQAQGFSIIIDAQKDAFYGTLTGSADGYVFISHRAYLDDLGGTPGIMPSSDKDCSAKVWFAYDTNYIYCYAEVKDDTVSAASDTRFTNDGIELKFDPDFSDGTGTGTANSRLTALGVGDSANGGIAHASGVDSINNSGNLKDASGVKWWPTGADFARRLMSDGYAVEFRIPFDYINVPGDFRFMIQREVGGVFGLAININDNDSGVRDALIQWAAGHSNNVHNDATLLGSATFLADHKLKLETVNARDPSIHNDSAAVWYTETATNISSSPSSAKSFKVLQNYPNPFNPSTTINFSIPADVNVSLTIYNIMGREVAQLISKELSAGMHTVEWNASGFASGVYYYRLSTGKYSETKKLILLK